MGEVRRRLSFPLATISQLQAPWTSGTVELAEEYRGIADPWTTPLEVRVPGDDAAFGVISDVDDTILETESSVSCGWSGRRSRVRSWRGRPSRERRSCTTTSPPAPTPPSTSPPAPGTYTASWWRSPATTDSRRAWCCSATCSAPPPVASRNPGRIIAIYIREVRRDPGDGRVEKVSKNWTENVPFVVATDGDAVRPHATAPGLL